MTQVKKIKICKCGHLRRDHKNKPDSKFSFPDECRKCKCCKYMNRKLPNGVSIGMLIYGSVIIGFLIMGSILLYLQATPIWNKILPVKVGTMITISIGLFSIAALMIGTSTILTYFKEKSRKLYPVEDGLE